MQFPKQSKIRSTGCYFTTFESFIQFLYLFLLCDEYLDFILQHFEIWTNIIKRVNNSVLIMKHFTDEATTNLKKEASKRGLNVLGSKINRC